MSYKVIEYLSGKQYGDTVSSVALARTVAYRAVEETGQAHQIVFTETRVMETVCPVERGPNFNRPADELDFDKLPRPVSGQRPPHGNGNMLREPPYESRGGGHHVWSTPAGKGDRDD